MPDEPPPDEEQLAWMTPEGRLKEIPIKNLSAGEEYTEDELDKLRAYWTEERTRAVAEWIDRGASPEDIPECLGNEGGNPLSEERPLDLRGIRLFRRLQRERTEKSPVPNLSEAHLEHANLQAAHLEHANLGGAHLEHAKLFMTHLKHADLRSAHLEHAELHATHLEHADLTRAHLRQTEMELTCISETALVNVYLDNTVFRPVNWKDERRRDPEATLFRGFDVRGIRYSDPLFDQWVKQANFIHAKRDIWWNPWRWLSRRVPRVSSFLKQWPPPLWLLWKGTCDCGRSVRRWAITCAAVAVLFGFLFWLCAGFWGMPVVELQGAVDPSQTNEPGRIVYPTTYLYFSIVTFTTLGFGDVTPTGLLGEFLVTVEVILGYVGLGGLISIFTTKLIPPR